MENWQVIDTVEDNAVLYEFRDVRLAERLRDAIVELMTIDLEITYEDIALLEGQEDFSPERYERFKARYMDRYQIVQGTMEEER